MRGACHIAISTIAVGGVSVFCTFIRKCNVTALIPAVLDRPTVGTAGTARAAGSATCVVPDLCRPKAAGGASASLAAGQVHDFFTLNAGSLLYRIVFELRDKRRNVILVVARGRGGGHLVCRTTAVATSGTTRTYG